MSNQVFEIVQAMSGQGNCITIPGPYLDFLQGQAAAFAGRHSQSAGVLVG
jgi:hypothetical protein